MAGLHGGGRPDSDDAGKVARRAWLLRRGADGATFWWQAYGSKYWHCKNRYSNQSQLLTAARYLHKHASGGETPAENSPRS